jgi:hypothetical protein
MRRIKKGFFYLRGRVSRWWSNLPLIRTLVFLGAMAAIAISTVAPSIESQRAPWSSFETWRSIIWGTPGIVILCTFYLRYEKDFFRELTKRNPAHRYEVRMATLAGLIDRSKGLNPTHTTAVQKFREDVLRCVMSGIAEQLDLEEDTLTANLLVLTAKNPRTMTVVARSKEVRRPNTEHPADESFLAWQAIHNGRIAVADNYREVNRAKRPDYRSIVAIPVIKGEVAYGSLSIDSTEAYAFCDRDWHIYCQCRPYISLLALTFGDSSPYHECRFIPRQFERSL